MSLQLSTPWIVLSTVHQTNTTEYIGEAFVDDTGLGVNNAEQEHQPDNIKNTVIANNLQCLGQEWENSCIAPVERSIYKRVSGFYYPRMDKWYSKTAHS